MPTKDDFPKDLAADAVLPFTLSGILLEIPRSILTPELWLAFEAGYYEGSEINALRSAIQPGDTVLEVGAGVGFISAFVQRVLGAATVVVIEANEALIPTIHRTHELNGVSATVLTGVAGHRDGPVRFHHQAAFWASSVLPLPDSRATVASGIDLGRVIREMRPDVLVVDIEGGERDLFAGLDLSGVRSIVVEVHHPQIGPGGIAKCFAALQAAGFAYYPDGSAGTNVMFTRFRSRRSPVGAVWAALMRCRLPTIRDIRRKFAWKIIPVSSVPSQRRLKTATFCRLSARLARSRSMVSHRRECEAGRWQYLCDQTT